MMDAWKLTGRRAVVTGATRGIGRAIAEEFLSLGAEVVAVARGRADLDEMVTALSSDALTVVSADVAEAQGREAVMSEVTARWGGQLDVLVNNVGTNIRKKTLDFAPDDFERLMAINLGSAWELSRASHPLMVAAGGGSIVNVSSVSGFQAVLTSTAPYAATKAGMDGLTRFLAAEWGRDNIRVNSVAPWYIRTPLAEAVLADDAKRALILARTPLGRVGDPADAARAVAFLAMPASGWITGAHLPVDGGFLVQGT